MDLSQLSASGLLERLNKKEISSQEVISHLRSRIEQVDGRVKAYLRLPQEPDSGLWLGQEEAQPRPSGLPIAIKDNICIQGQPVTCASKILEGFVAPYEATVITKLKEAGLRPFGQTNMDEFAFGSSCENSAYFPTRNPWNLECVPGGSSGGSAAAVAASEAIWALGTDTGGSIRQPASFCGVVGLKPTYGRVSRYGLIAFGSSLDQIGPLTKNVEDCALLSRIISGYDPKDSTSVNAPVADYPQSLGKDVRGLKIGVPKEYFSLNSREQIEGLDPQVKSGMEEAIAWFKKLGAKVEEVSLPHSKYAVNVYYILATAEASSNLARFDGVQYGLRSKSENLLEMYKRTRQQGFGYEAKRRIILGTYVLSRGYYDAYYVRAQKVRSLIARDFSRVFNDFDCIISPTSPTPAFKLGERLQNPLAMYLSDVYTISVNLAGIPAISLPCGMTKDGLPIGLQIMARPFDEEMIFRVGHCYEQSTHWHTLRPKI